MTIYEEPFGRFRPFGIGFDEAFLQLDKLHATTTGNYPPYNIVKVDEENFLVEIAAAGFAKSDFDITLKDGSLTIAAKSEKEDAKEYMHKGIAARSFERTFALAEHVDVKGVSYKDGILLVELSKVIPEEEKPKKFTIK